MSSDKRIVCHDTYVSQIKVSTAHLIIDKIKDKFDYLLYCGVHRGNLRVTFCCLFVTLKKEKDWKTLNSKFLNSYLSVEIPG